MCFIKNLFKKENLNTDPTDSTIRHLDSSVNEPANMELLKDFMEFNHFGKIAEIQQRQNQQLNQQRAKSFLVLSNLVTRNSDYLTTVDEKLDSYSDKIDNLLRELTKINQNQEQGYKRGQDISYSEAFKEQMTEDPSEESFLCENPLIKTIFQKSQYLYRLQLVQEFPAIIYKERNIKLSVNLINKAGVAIKNSNVINLSFALCDNNGKWIFTNRVNDPMLKGKTQTQLYHGAGSFNKIYPKDISRTHIDGVVNVVVYPKGHTAKNSRHIDESMIEPLIITNVVIMAKKTN